MGEKIYVYSNTLSNIMNTNNSGSQKKSSSGSKNKYQIRNSQRKTIIENSDSSIKYLMELLIPPDNLLEEIEQKHLFDETRIEVDPSKLSNIFLEENINFLQEFFSETAWELVKHVVANKRKLLLPNMR